MSETLFQCALCGYKHTSPSEVAATGHVCTKPDEPLARPELQYAIVLWENEKLRALLTRIRDKAVQEITQGEPTDWDSALRDIIEWIDGKRYDAA